MLSQIACPYPIRAFDALTNASGFQPPQETAVAAPLGLGPKRARSLAYRLHAVSDRKGSSAEALAYNALATSCPQIQSAMAQRGTTQSLLPGMDSVPQQVEN